MVNFLNINNKASSFSLKDFFNYISGSCCMVPSQYGIYGALYFFIYNFIKVFFLLSLLIFVISFIKTYFPPERTKDFFNKSKLNGILGNIIASLLGVITPFCSCSAVSLFIGFIESGAPLGATFSFLISSPMVNEVALVLLFIMFGWKISLLYMLTGVLIAIIGGLVIGKLNMEKYVEEYVYEIRLGQLEIQKLTLKQRIYESLSCVKQILKRTWLYILIGIGVGAVMYGWVPDGMLQRYISRDNPLSVLIAVAIGVPIYANAAGVMPIVSELTRLGVPIGAALAFIMSVTALSLPEIIILRNVLKPKLLAMFVGIISITIVIIGYMFNIIL